MHLWDNIFMKVSTKQVDLKGMSRRELEDYAMSKSLESEELSAKLAWYEEQLKLSRSKKFGKSSEKTHEGQISIFNEAEETAYADMSGEPSIDKALPANKSGKKKGHRKQMLATLPSETIEYTLSEEEQICPVCGEALHDMTTDVRSEIILIPARTIVKKHVTHSYSCRNCEKNAISVPIIKASSPAPLIKGSICSASLISYIINNKYVLALPLYRQEQEFRRLGMDITRQNMSNWLIKVAKGYLLPIYRLLHEELIGHDVIHADETTVEVLKEPGRGASSNSYMWLYRTGEESDKQIALFEYRQGRSGDFPKEFLSGFKGYLHTDGYSGYNKLVNTDEDPPPVVRVGCWAHARRKYDEALRPLTETQKQAASLTRKGLAYCNMLFSFEREWAELDADTRLIKRSEIAAPIVNEYFAWVKATAEIALAQSGLGKAVDYSLRQEAYLRNYLRDGRLEISNNLAERTIKPFVIGRKNWLFSNTPGGAESSAVIYSIVQTAMDNGLNAAAYIEFILNEMPNIDITIKDNARTLLPWSERIPDSAKQRQD